MVNSYDFAPLLFVLLDSAGLVLEANPNAWRLLGPGRKQLLGMPFRRWVMEDERRQFVDHLHRARRTTRTVASDLFLNTRKRGQIAVKAYTRRARQGQRLTFPTVIVDVSEYATLAFELDLAESARHTAEHERELARTADAAKDRLIAVVSHELRNPLGPAMTAAGTLTMIPDLPPLVRQLAGIIHRNIETEAQLIDDLLDVSRITRGQMRLSLGVTDVHDVIVEAVTACTSAAASRDVSISIDLRAGRHHAWADAVRLRQVFWNLLLNAVKFSERGATVLVGTTVDEESRIRIVVADQGIGMDADTLAGLFRPFAHRARPHDGRGGLGVGLTICHGIMEAHDGELSAASGGPGQGATFAVTLMTVDAPGAATALATG
jgi:PAS domain S-box-containing protein